MLWTIVWYSTLGTIAIALLLVSVGDVLLTLVARQFASKYVKSTIKISWSMLEGSFVIENLELGENLLPIVGSSLGLPAESQATTIKYIGLHFPLFKVIINWLRKDQNTERFGIFIDGITTQLRMDESKKWRWKLKENKVRFEKDILLAKTNRVALLESWTSTIISKLDAYNKAKGQPKREVNEYTLLAGIWGESIDLKLQSYQKPLQMIDALISSFELAITNTKLQLRPPQSVETRDMELVIFLGELSLSRAEKALENEQRELLIKQFAIQTLRDQVGKRTPITFSILEPWTVSIGIVMPPIVQGLHHAPKDIDTIVEISPFYFSVFPDQVQAIMDILRPQTEYGIWYAQAARHDENNCKIFSGDEPKDYITNYQNYTQTIELPYWKKAVKNHENREKMVKLANQLKSIEETHSAWDILLLRQKALNWDVPKFAEAIPTVSDEVLAWSTLEKFISTPLDHYDSNLSMPLVLGSINLKLKWSSVVFEFFTNDQAGLLKIYLSDIAINLHQSMQLPTVDPDQMAVNVVVGSFGVQDVRQSPSNVFQHILARNPDCTNMLEMDYSVYNTKTTLSANVANFSLIVLTVPIFEAQAHFASALDDDEETIIWRDENDTIVVPTKIIYKSETSDTYDPSKLGHQELDILINIVGCEVCLLADPAKELSHQLAFTSDMKLRVESSELREYIALTLIDVALQPCVIKMNDDAIDLTLPGLRTLLELEGDGVDLELKYEMVFRKADKPTLKSTQSTSERAKSKWAVLQNAIKNDQIKEDKNNGRGIAENATTVATRNISMEVSDFALNVSKEDIGLFAAIQGRINAAMELSEDEVAMKEEHDARIAQARTNRLEAENQARLERQFYLLDKDGGGTLDDTEIASLLDEILNDFGLTTNEKDTFREKLFDIVDENGDNDVSFDEFKFALDPNVIHYTWLHLGALPLTGREYKNPKKTRAQVPRDLKTLHDTVGMDKFVKTFDEQTGATLIEKDDGQEKKPPSLNGQSPRVVQQKMVRCFESYEYAQEAWTRIVEPLLTKPSEKVPWLLLDTELMGVGMTAIQHKFTQNNISITASVSALESSGESPEFALEPVFIETIVKTTFGGFYFRVVDTLLPAHVPALELAFEEVKIKCSFNAYESSGQISPTKQQANNGMGTIRGAIYCKYYNNKARQLEPFIEYFPTQLVVKKEVNKDIQCLVVSDHYLHVNLTTAFMSAVNSITASFYESQLQETITREHVKVLNAMCWMYNDIGMPMKYYVQIKESAEEDVPEKPPRLVSDKLILPSLEYGLCKILEEEKEMKGALLENMKEKEMRSAFRKADTDNSGELDTEEVKQVLQSVLKSYASLSEEDVNKRVKKFIADADEDNSGQVSWKEFQAALAKTQDKPQRTLTLEVEGYEPIHLIPLDVLGEDAIYELVPVINSPMSTPDEIYDTAVKYLDQENPTMDDITRAIYLLKKLQKDFKWTASYLSTYEKQYFPRLIAVYITSDSTYGMTVIVKTAECIRNNTAKVTEIQLYESTRQVSFHNPLQQSGERFYSISPYSYLRIPLPLIDHGTFAIRQVGEVDWSNTLPLSVAPGRASGNRKIDYDVIDGQPTTIECKNGTWSIDLQAQFVVTNTLPCVIEYAIVQASDVPANSIEEIDLQSSAPFMRQSAASSQQVTGDDRQSLRITHLESAASRQSSSSVKLAAEALTSSKISQNKMQKKLEKLAPKVDPWFVHVNEVNSRCGRIVSGNSVHISGLDLREAAFMKIRLLSSEQSTNGTWSAPFLIPFHQPMKHYTSTKEVSLPKGPTVLINHTWVQSSPRTIEMYVPYWIENHSGLDMNYKVHHGKFCTWQEHKSYFGENFHKIPLLLCAPENAELAVQPFQETEPSRDHQSMVATSVRKYLPDFKKISFSDSIDLASVGTRSEISCGLTECVLGYEIMAAPGQFQHTKIALIVPRYIVKNCLTRPLQIRPITVSKKSKPEELEKINANLRQDAAIILYRFVGKKSHTPAIQVRDAHIDQIPEGYKRDETKVQKLFSTAGLFLPLVAVNEKTSATMWLRGPLSNAPLLEVDVQPNGLTTFITLNDRTRNPEIRIENRSTRTEIRYGQLGTTDLIALEPHSWNSFAWTEPFAKDVRLKVFVGQTATTSNLVDLKYVHQFDRLTDDGESFLHGEVYIDGTTRVLAFSDGPLYHHDRRPMTHDIWFDTEIELGLHGLGVTIVDPTPREIMNITMEGLRMYTPGMSNKITYELHHFQIDDMTPHTMYPIVLAPLDSGFNSHKREGWLPEMGEHPYLRFVIESYCDRDMLIVDELTATIGSISLKLNLDYSLEVLDAFYALFWPPQTPDEIVQAGVLATNLILDHKVTWPDPSTFGQNMYMTKCNFSDYMIELVFNSDPDASNTYLMSLLGNTAGSIVSGIAHVTPEFKIRSVVMKDRFVYKDDLIYNIIIWDSIVGNILGQWYKIVGSLELMGDPMGLVNEIADGFALAARQTKRDFKGESQKKGQGAITLLQTVVGAPSDAIGKAANGFGDILKKATYFENQEEENEPRHLPEGLLQGGVLFGKSIANGFTGLVKKPMEGVKEEGFKGFAKGVGQGTIGLVASPFIGTLGAIEKLSQSVHNTTHLMDAKEYDGTRRIARKLEVEPLKSLLDSNIISEMEIQIVKVTGLAMNYSVQVYVQLFETDGHGNLVREVDKFKTSTKRNTAAPIFNQSRVVDISSIDMALVFTVAHKRKPIPKKILGTFQISLDKVYTEFEAIPFGFKTNARVKNALKSRKVHHGSLFTDVSQKDEAGVVEAPWESTYIRASTVFEAEEKEVPDDRASISRRTETMNSLPAKIKPFKLEDAKEGSPIIWLCIRYLNSMRT
ncbi:hypothetical protein THRCLA_08436 [Thraustotheca clavata]|uniref:Uncharacterized protein n=1 Tax=Thraustotheca clavata TaxID=74557 RepID=A0A1V9Z6D0_9STRA|nr:hypothetical protein THRCLA_08436 [Thraustotheca clavata]